MLVGFLIFLVIVLLLYDRWSRREVYRLGKQLTCRVKAYPFIGHSYLFLGDNHSKYYWLRYSLLNILKQCTMNTKSIVINIVFLERMEALQILGRDALKNDNGLFPAWQGNYLYTISIWRPRRKVLVPTFNMKNLKSFVTIFVRHSAILVQELGKLSENVPLSAFKYYTAYTMDAIAGTATKFYTFYHLNHKIEVCYKIQHSRSYRLYTNGEKMQLIKNIIPESTLGYKMDAQKSSDHPFLKAFNYGLPKCAERLCQPWLHSDFIYKNLPVYTRLVKLKEYLWNFMIELIKAKRKEIKHNKPNKDTENLPEESIQTFLECLIRSSGGDNGYTDIEIVEELMVIMVAGNDTSAVGTSFVSLILSRHPEVQEKIYEELQEVFGDSDRLATFEDLPRLKYLDAVIRETLRLYPPVPIIVRKVENHVPLPSGVTLVPGTGVLVHIWALHRNPRYWGDDAEQFRPERFLDSQLKHPAAFMAFSHGPRNCAGYQYAMMSMKTVLSTVLRRFKFLPAVPCDSGFPPLKLTFDLMMKDENNFQIRLERRIKR
ncbi:hypothetical protein HF086_000031 [Spodoptera exigua]|uniref:Cytochrome p450 n=1 Tax=Spodoptera exigua TaxID=7107 RepID=A0A922MYQ2_SPOEX|nr:hypothetical protein HF086_000031 [Spodoptera exigua]